MSFVVAEVEASHDGEKRWGANNLILSDFYRTIQLEFCLGSRVHRRRSLAKIDLLIKSSHRPS